MKTTKTVRTPSINTTFKKLERLCELVAKKLDRMTVEERNRQIQLLSNLDDSEAYAAVERNTFVTYVEL